MELLSPCYLNEYYFVVNNFFFVQATLCNWLWFKMIKQETDSLMLTGGGNLLTVLLEALVILSLGLGKWCCTGHRDL